MIITFFAHCIESKFFRLASVRWFSTTKYVNRPRLLPYPSYTWFRSGIIGYAHFTRLDLIKAYYQIPVEESDMPKTAITTPFDLFEFTRMAFGLRNAAQSFHGVDRWSVKRFIFHIRVHRRRINSNQKYGRTPGTSPTCFWKPFGLKINI